MPLPDADNIGESILPDRSETYVVLTPIFRWAPVKTLAIKQTNCPEVLHDKPLCLDSYYMPIHLSCHFSKSSFVKRVASASATINSMFSGYQRSRARLRLNELLATDRQAGQAQKPRHLHLEK